MINVNPAIGKGSGPEKEKFHSYLGVIAQEKIPIVHIWDDIFVCLHNYLSMNLFTLS